MDTKLLKQKILDLAIRGKLVPQDPNDEPASVLLEKIKQEKQNLIKQGKIKKDKNESTIFIGDDKLHYEKFADGTIKNIENEIPFEIPDTWCWCRLKDISTYGYSLHKKSNEIKDLDWVLDLEEIESHTGRILQKFTNSKKHTTSDKCVFKAGQVLYSKLRPYLNKVVIADSDGLCTTEIMPLSLIPNMYNKYIQHFLMSKYFIKYAISCSYGCKMPRLGTQDGQNALISVPNFKEQQRIVAKIEELFAKVDKIEEEKQSLLKLIDRTKDKVLDLAMKGKLVKQDPNDEPASVLLEKIFEEKKQLAKEGKIKLSKDELLQPKISDDNDYYEKFYKNRLILPLKRVCLLSKPTETNNGLLPYLEVKYLRAQIPAKIINKGLYLPNNSNVILVDGENSGEVFNTKENGYMGSTFMQLIISKYVNHSYIKFFITSKKELLKNNKKGSAIPHLNKELFNNLEIYLPPITEQNKIVKTLNNIINSLNNIKAEL